MMTQRVRALKDFRQIKTGQEFDCHPGAADIYRRRKMVEFIAEENRLDVALAATVADANDRLDMVRRGPGRPRKV